MSPLSQRSKSEQKRLERILILRTIINYGGSMAGADIADRASTECDHDALDDLPEISRRGIGQKLNAMSLDGLVAYSPVPGRDGGDWFVTEAGRDLAASLAPLPVWYRVEVRESRDAVLWKIWVGEQCHGGGSDRTPAIAMQAAANYVRDLEDGNFDA